MKWWDWMPWSYFFWMLNFKPALLLSSFTLIKRLFSSFSLSAIRVVSSAYIADITWISEFVDTSPSKLDSTLWFIQPGILHDIFCIYVKLAGWKYTALMYSFPNLEPVCSSVSGSNCRFLTCIQVSQKMGKVVWHSHLFKNFHSLLWSTQSKALM